MTSCPWCAEEIPDGPLEVCPHCGSKLSPELGASGGWAAMPEATGTDGAPGGDAEPGPDPAARTPGHSTVAYTHSGYRYVLGYDPTGYAIWDRQAPGGSPLRFPRTDDGWQDAWRHFASLEPQQASVGPPAVGSIPQGQGSGLPAAPRTNGMAVASLVTAILFIPIVPIVLGHISKRDIERSQGAQEGRGLAIAGIVMGWVTLGLLILMVLAAVLFFSAFGDQIVGFIEHDADSRTLLQNAVVEVNHYQDKEGSFQGLSPAKLEPSSIDWNTLTYPKDGEVSIRDVGADRVLLVTRTNLGVDYCAAIMDGRTSYGTENPSSAAGCTGGWAFDWDTSQ